MSNVPVREEVGRAALRLETKLSLPGKLPVARMDGTILG